MSDLPDLPAGVWTHYKGHPYLVIGYALDSDTEDRTVVVYIGLSLDGARDATRMKVRTAEDFLACVDVRTGESIHHEFRDGVCHLRRFMYAGTTVDLGARHG